MSTIDISGLDKGTVLAALYNAAAPRGYGFLEYDPTPMTAEQGTKLLVTQMHFDYLLGRLLKLSFDGDALDVRLYDRAHGDDVARLVIATLRAGRGANDDFIAAVHNMTLQAGIAMAEEAMGYDVIEEEMPGGKVITLGLASQAEALRAAVARAKKGKQACG